MVFGLGRKQHKVKVTARGRGTAPPPELMVPNALIPTMMPPAAPMGATYTTMMPPPAPIMPPTYNTVMHAGPMPAPPMVVGETAPVVTTETLAVQYPTESRVMAYAPPSMVEETTVYQQALPPPAPAPQEAPVEISLQRIQPPLPAGYESDEEFLQSVKYAQKDVLTDDDTDSYTSFEEEVYCIVPPGTRAPRDLPLNSYRHGYRLRGGPAVIDQYYEGPTPSPRQSLPPRRSELYSYTDIPVARNATQYSPSPRLDGTARAYRTAERFVDAPSPSYNRRGRYY